MSESQNTSTATDPLPVPDRKKKSFAGDVLKIMGGTAFGQVLGIAALPILTRLFSPEAFGLLGVYGAVTGILGVVVCMRYELAIVLPKEDRDAANLLWVSLSFAITWSAVVGLIILFFRNGIATLIGAPDIAPLLWLIPVGVLIHGAYIALSHWNTRRRQFGRLAAAQIYNALVTTSSKLGAGFGGLISGGALIVASLTGRLTSAAVLGRRIWLEDAETLKSGISLNRTFGLLREYKNISIFNSSSSIFDTLSQNLPLVLLGSFFGPATVGFYALGSKLIKVPSNLIAKSIKKVFFQRASSQSEDKTELSSLVGNVASKLAILAFFISTILIITAKPVITTVLGREWIVTAQYLQWIVPFTLMRFVATPVESVSLVLKKEHFNLAFQVVGFVLRTGSILVGGLVFRDAYVTVMLYCGVGAIYYLFFIAWILRISNVTGGQFFSKVGPISILSIIAVALYALVDISLDEKSFVKLGIVSIYSLMVFILNRKEIRESINLLRPNRRQLL